MTRVGKPKVPKRVWETVFFLRTRSCGSWLGRRMESRARRHGNRENQRFLCVNGVFPSGLVVIVVLAYGP